MPIQTNNWADLTWPADCDTDLDLVAIAADQECFITPPLSQVSDLYITPDNSPAATEPFTWVSSVPSANASGIDNTVTDNTKSKQITVKGGVAAPEKVEVAGPKRQTNVIERKYTLELEVEVTDNSMRELLRQLQSGWTSFKFWYGTLGGNLFGPEAGIRPSKVDAELPLDAADDGREVGRIIIEFISVNGDPVRNTNPYS